MQNMRISIAKDVTANNGQCHGDLPQVNGRDGLVGCFEECFIPDTSNTGSITGDYLLIPAGKYTDNSTPPPKMYNNDYYCGVGLANIENRVRVEMPGPVIVRSGHFIS